MKIKDITSTYWQKENTDGASILRALIYKMHMGQMVQGCSARSIAGLDTCSLSRHIYSQR